MKKRLLFSMFLASFTAFAQYTAIPDVNFEKVLISLGVDSVLDGQVLTANIKTVNSLYFPSNNVTDLTGIQDFIALESLDCQYNQLASLDVSKNTKLYAIYCNNNLLTSLDVSKNTLLSTLFCNYNQLTSLNVSLNFEMSFLYCDNNQITSLDVSKNPKLIHIRCNYNQLTSLNLKNGNNTIIRTEFSGFGGNNLSCIQVDNVNYSNSNWETIKDDTATYSTDCITLGIADRVFDKVTIYPNPSKSELHIDNVALEKVAIYNALGNLVKEISFANSLNNTINLATLSKGVYFMNLQAEGVTAFKKIIVE
jgi:hypothetical protein